MKLLLLFIFVLGMAYPHVLSMGAHGAVEMALEKGEIGEAVSEGPGPHRLDDIVVQAIHLGPICCIHQYLLVYTSRPDLVILDFIGRLFGRAPPLVAA